jgi:Recombination endonuclease VII
MGGCPLGMGKSKRTKEQISIDIAEQRKTCCVCDQRFSFENFYNFKNKSDGKSYRCKGCDDKARHSWKLKHPVRSERSMRNQSLLVKYGISLVEYEELLEQQSFVCAICKQQERHRNKDCGVSNLAVDHCHKSNKIRGLLCNRCNRGLGLLGDSEEILSEALNYLRKQNG